jgi:hypothetical protein
LFRSLFAIRELQGRTDCEKAVSHLPVSLILSNMQEFLGNRWKIPSEQPFGNIVAAILQNPRLELTLLTQIVDIHNISISMYEMDGHKLDRVEILMYQSRISN